MRDELLQACIDACVSCAIECEHCATKRLREEDVNTMAHCIGLNWECASVCRSAAELMSIEGEHSSLLCLSVRKYVMLALLNVKSMELCTANIVLKNVGPVVRSAVKWQPHMYSLPWFFLLDFF